MSCGQVSDVCQEKSRMQLRRSLMSTDLIMEGFNGSHLEMKKESNREASPIISVQPRQSVLP